MSSNISIKLLLHFFETITTCGFSLKFLVNLIIFKNIMDDFSSEMKEILESSKSYSYFPNIYEKALILINPGLASDMPDIGDKIKTPFDKRISGNISK